MIKNIWSRFKNLGKVLSIILIVLFGSLSYGTFKLINYTSELHKKLSVHEEKDARIEIIQKTLIQGYGDDKGLTVGQAQVCAPIFDTISRAYHVPWQAFAAVARIESNFNPVAHSKENALGLMQVEPQTAIPIAKQLGIRYSPELLYKPEGIKIGCILFSNYYKANLRNNDTLKAIKEALRCYVGGENHFVLNDTAQIYIKDYMVTTSQEYDHFVLISKGVLYDSLLAKYKEEKEKNIFVILFDRIKRI